MRAGAHRKAARGRASRRAGFSAVAAPAAGSTALVSPAVGSSRCAGFTLIEVLIVLVISSLTFAFAALTFTGYFHRDSARRAAQVFALDLTAARAFALRSREPVVIRFHESSLWYEVETQGTATEVARRRFGQNADIDLSGVSLDMAGDSVVFSARGVADMSGAGGPLGTATFSSGAASYTVSFNGLGASKVERT